MKMYEKLSCGALVLLLLVGGYLGKIGSHDDSNPFSECNILNGFLQRFENLAWRNIEDIDFVLEEFWCDGFLAKEKDFINGLHFFYNLDAVNNEDRPVLFMHFGKKLELEFLKAFSISNFERLFQCASGKILRDAFRIASSGGREGETVPKIDMVLDLGDSNLGGSCCPMCGRMLMDLPTKSLVSRIFFINSPEGFGGLHPPNCYALQNSSKGQTTHIIGDWIQWEKILFQYFAREELPDKVEQGGRKGEVDQGGRKGEVEKGGRKSDQDKNWKYKSFNLIKTLLASQEQMVKSTPNF